MVNLLTGPKGSGKTQKMIELANEQAKKCDGNVVFIKKTHRDTASVSTTTDAYIGFLYGMHSSNNDIQCVFIDGILKHADISIENMPEFIERLKQMSKECDMDFYVSISAKREELSAVNLEGCAFLN